MRWTERDLGGAQTQNAKCVGGCEEAGVAEVQGWERGSASMMPLLRDAMSTSLLHQNKIN